MTLLVQACFPVFFGLSLYTGNLLILLWVLYVLFPVLDLVLPRDYWNPSPAQARSLEKDSRFLIPLYFTFFSDVAIYLYSLHLIANDNNYNGSVVNFTLLALMTAQCSAANGAVGHELFHRRSKIHRMFGILGYAKFFYSHFYPSHIKYHHKTVGTPEDPVTARLNETALQYFQRCIPGKILEVWNHNNTSRKHWLSPKNEMLPHLALNISILLAITWIYGFLGGLFALTQATMCILMIEIVNYVEHYGLKRSKDENGVYEPVSVRHSWNAP